MPEGTYTTAEVAAILGIDESRVKRLAVSRHLGHKFGERLWMFSDVDIEAMRTRKRGRPPKKREEPNG